MCQRWGVSSTSAGTHELQVGILWDRKSLSYTYFCRWWSSTRTSLLLLKSLQTSLTHPTLRHP